MVSIFLKVVYWTWRQLADGKVVKLVSIALPAREIGGSIVQCAFVRPFRANRSDDTGKWREPPDLVETWL
jgi:hypothetical protein